MKFNSSFLAVALAVCRLVAAAPSDETIDVQLCTDANYEGTCVDVSAISEECFDLNKTLSISSLKLIDLNPNTICLASPQAECEGKAVEFRESNPSILPPVTVSSLYCE